MSYSIGKKVSSQLIKVELNEYGDYILINPGDYTLSKRFSELIQWMEDKQAELGKLASEMNEKYKDTPMISADKEGNASVDTEQLSLYVKIKNELYEECQRRIGGLFGQDVLKKYFRALYEINPDFVPDEECIMDFLEEISPVLQTIYQESARQINQKYGKNRKQGVKRSDIP